MLDLLPGGSEVEVLYKDKDAWLEKVKESYLTEVDEQCAAIRRGLLGAAIPLPYLVLTSSDTLERAIVRKNDGVCMKNEELCIKNMELCIKKEEFCI